MIGFMQDDTGANSSKRLAFLAATAVTLVMACLHQLDTVEALKPVLYWLGTLIAAETVIPALQKPQDGQTQAGR